MNKNDIDLIDEYDEYCKRDGKKMYHLPFVIWLKHKKKIKHFTYNESTGEIIIYDKKI